MSWGTSEPKQEGCQKEEDCKVSTRFITKENLFDAIATVRKMLEGSV